MALIKKFKSGDKTEEPKKVLTRQNIGDYDADELSKNLTDSLQSEADKYKGSDRQAFLKYGSQLIQAIKDGNVTINTDGSISINGSYGLNNDYTDKEIQDMKDNGKVGRGASAYQGEYQRSHGIFTTNGTENFRNDNHLIGLTGRWLMNNLNDAKPIVDVEKPAQEAPKYTFDTAFADKHLNGIVANKAAWFKNNTEATKKIQDIIDALNSADKEKWGMSDKDFSTLLNALEASKESKDYTAVKNAALNLGFDLSSYLPRVVQSIPKDEATLNDEQLLATIKGNNQFASQEVLQSLLRQEKNKIKQANQKVLDDEYNQNMLQSYLESLNNYIPESLIGDYVETYNFEENLDYRQMGDMLNAQLAAIEDDPEFANKVSPMISQVNRFIQAYDQMGDEDKADFYEIVPQGNYKDWVVIAPTVTNKYSIIFNPNTKQYKRVLNQFLTGTEAQRANYASYSRNYELEHPRITTSFKEGGVLFMQGGGWAQRSKNIAQRHKGDNVTLYSTQPQTTPTNKETSKSEDVEEVPFESTKLKDISDWDYTDWANATSAALDVASLATSLTTSEFGGSLVAGGLGLASTISEGVADYGRAKNAGQYWDATKNAGTNLLFDAVGLLPWGRLAKAGKTTSKALKYVPYVGMAAASVMAPDMAKSFMAAFNKVIEDPTNLTTDDLRALTAGAEILTGFTQAKRANRVADTATPAGMEVKTEKGTVKVDQKTLEEMQNASSYEAANKIFRKAQGEKPVADANVPGGVNRAAKSNPNIYDLPQGTKWGNNKEGSWYSWRVPNGKPIIEGKLLRSLDDQVVVPGLLGHKVVDTKDVQKLTSKTVGQAFSDIYTRGVGEGLVRATGAVGRTVADGISTATRAGRHKLKRYSYKELGLDPKKQYTAQEFTDAVKAYEHKQGLLDAVGRGNANRRDNPLQESISEQGGKAQEAINEQRVKAMEEYNAQVRKRAKRIANIRRRNAQAESKAKTEAKAKEIREKVQKLFNDKSAAIRTKTTGLMQRFNERLEEYQTAKRRERNLRDIELQNKRDSYNSPEARAARKAAEEQQQAIRSSLARQMFGGPYYASLSEPLQIKGLEVPSLSKTTTTKPETPTKKTGHIPKKTKNKRYMANKASEGMKFAQAAISNINKSEDLETLWLKAGGQILYAKKGYKIGNEVFENKPANGDYIEIEIPEWLTATNGKYDISNLKADEAGNYSGELNDGYSYVANGQQWQSYDSAKRHGDVTIAKTFNRNNWDVDTNWLNTDTFGKNSTGNNGYTHNYSVNDAGKSAAQLEAGIYKGTDIIGYDQKNFDDWNEVLTRYSEWGELTPNEEQALLNYMIYQNQQNFKSAGNKNLYFDREGAITDIGSLTLNDLRPGAVHNLITNKRTDAAKRDSNGNVIKDSEGNPTVIKTTAAGTAHQSMRRQQYKTATNNYIVQEDGTLKLAGEDFDQSKYETAFASDNSLTEDTDYTNNYWKVAKSETKVGSNGPEDRIIAAGNTPQYNLNNTRQLGNVLEGLRTAYLNYNNRIAAKEAMDWDPALKQQLHRIELLEGNYQALREAQNGRERLNSQASKTFTSDAALQLAGQLTATAQGNALQMDAAKADADRFYNSRHKVMDLANQDLAYNTQVGDYNRSVLSQYGKEKAGIKANLRIENAKNWGNLLAGISKQMFDAGDRENQLALQHVQTVAGNANQAAYLKYLKDNDIDAYYKALQENAIEANKKSAGIIGFRPFSYTTVAKKGGRLTPTHQYILQGSKSFNKRKLEEAREFHKNMRKKK